VTCSAVHHLLTDEKLEGFDTRYKVVPPLRTEIDRQAVMGIPDDTIDMITSDHNHTDKEQKMNLIWLKRNNRIRKCVWP
jgi:dihydroorotase